MRSAGAYADPTANRAIANIMRGSDRTARRESASRDKRREIERYIGEHPGADVRTIGRAVHLGRTATLEHVVNLLLDSQIVKAPGRRQQDVEVA